VTDSKPIELKAEALKQLCLNALQDMKAKDIIILDVRQQASFTDTMVFASGTSRRHVSSIAESLVQAAEVAGMAPLGVEGETVGEWVLVDLGDVVVHVMLPETRAFYELEKLWGEEMLVGT
jgi:ribosome-associated protein